MSKAFKGEDASEAPLVVPPRAPLPPGVERARADAAGTEDVDRPRTLVTVRVEEELEVVGIVYEADA